VIIRIREGTNLLVKLSDLRFGVLESNSDVVAFGSGTVELSGDISEALVLGVDLFSESGIGMFQLSTSGLRGGQLTLEIGAVRSGSVEVTSELGDGGVLVGVLVRKSSISLF